MITRIFGKIIENVYSINDCTEVIKEDNKDVTIFTNRPRFLEEIKIKAWQQICEYEGEPRYNRIALWSSGLSDTRNIYVGEGPENKVKITEEIFRADINECHLYSDKVLESNDLNKVEIEGKFNNMVYCFNESIISRTPELATYCKLHKLDPKETDCEELFKLLHPNDKYKFVNGSLQVINDMVETVVKVDKFGSYELNDQVVTIEAF